MILNFVSIECFLKLKSKSVLQKCFLDFEIDYIWLVYDFSLKVGLSLSNTKRLCPGTPKQCLHIMCTLNAKYLPLKIPIHISFVNFNPLSYSGVPLKLDARVTRFTFSAAISKSLELKRSSIPL